MDDDLPCEPPMYAEVGDVWICPDCARKYHYIFMYFEDLDLETECWYTGEIGF